MNTYIKKLTPLAALTAIAILPSTALAGELSPQTIVVQTEVNADELPLLTDIVYEAALADAAAKTLDEDKDWFHVTYRESTTAPVTINVKNDAESRYIDLEDGERVELAVPEKDVLIQVQKINFEMGSGPMPEQDNVFDAKEVVLPTI